jgi:hypothetical protein
VTLDVRLHGSAWVVPWIAHGYDDGYGGVGTRAVYVWRSVGWEPVSIMRR